MGVVLPFEIREAIVSVCGKRFWLKEPFRAFKSCGVPPELYDPLQRSQRTRSPGMLSELDGLDDEGLPNSSEESILNWRSSVRFQTTTFLILESSSLMIATLSAC